MNKTILSYDDVKDIKFGDSDEPLVKANTYDARIICEYKKLDMFAWTGFDILVRDSVARKIAEVNSVLQRQYGLTLKVVYGYRSLEVQRAYFDMQYNTLKLNNPTMNDEELLRLTHNFVAVPDTAGHTLGAAVDLTLVDAQGECDMGTPIANYSDQVVIQTFARTGKIQAHRRKILMTAMMDAGFAPFLGEWWHFSYGDKEWAAYYELNQALYAPIEIPKKARQFLIAGGNKTALQIVAIWQGSYYNQLAGEALMRTFNGIDQAGIYYEDIQRLEMSGGEFCGNATAATAVLLSKDSSKQTYETSGFNGLVTASVQTTSVKKWRVTTTFNTMSYQQSRTILSDIPIDIVDFGGIVHLLIEDSLPNDYLREARKIRNQVQLNDSDAVGVIWYKRNNDSIKINPVVWVKKINTQFYEASCGSGAIAAAVVSGMNEIIQSNGQSIFVDILQNAIQTKSNIEEV